MNIAIIITRIFGRYYCREETFICLMFTALWDLENNYAHKLLLLFIIIYLLCMYNANRPVYVFLF